MRNLQKSLFIVVMAFGIITLLISCQKEEDTNDNLNIDNLISNNSSPIFSIKYDMEIMSFQELATGTESIENLEFLNINRAVPIKEKNRIELDLYENGNSKFQIEELSAEQRFPSDYHVTKSVIHNGLMQCYNAKNELILQQDFTGQLPQFNDIIEKIKDKDSVPINLIMSKTMGTASWGEFETVEEMATYLESEYGATVTIGDENMAVIFQLPVPISSGEYTGDEVKIIINLENKTMTDYIIYDSNLNTVISGIKVTYIFNELEVLHIPIIVNSVTRIVKGNGEVAYNHVSRSIENLEITY